MLYRSLIGLVGVAALVLSMGNIQASEDMKYPDWRGPWGRFIVRGLPGQPSLGPHQGLGSISAGPADAGVSKDPGRQHGGPSQWRTR